MCLFEYRTVERHASAPPDSHQSQSLQSPEHSSLDDATDRLGKALRDHSPGGFLVLDDLNSTSNNTAIKV